MDDRLEAKVRLDRELHRVLMAAARKRSASLTSEIVARLQASIEAQPAIVAVAKPPAPAEKVKDEGYSKKAAKLLAEVAQLREVISSRPAGVLIGKLSTAKIAQHIKKARDGKLKGRWFGDGGNLWLQITSGGAGVSWVFRWTDRKTGGERSIGLGSFQDVDLDLAREKARQNRLLLAEGKDPKQERDNSRLDVMIAAGLAKTVSQVADEYSEQKIAHRSAAYRKQTQVWLKTFVHDTIGERPIQKVNQNTILDECRLRELWTSQHPTALGLHSHLSRMFDLAIARGYYQGKNPAAWKGLQHILPASRDIHTTKHHASLPYTDTGRFMEKVRAYRDRRPQYANERTTVSFAVEFLVLTGVRRGEVRNARWKEIDLSRGVWNVPPEHLKTGHRHHKMRSVPISKPMRDVLDEMQKRRRGPSPEEFVFPGKWSHDGGLNSANFNQFTTQQLGWEIHITQHGFRSTLRDWCRTNRFPEVLWKRQVDHVTGNKTDQSYGHDDLIEERRGMMELWGEYCSKPAPPEPKAAGVVKLSDKRRQA